MRTDNLPSRDGKQQPLLPVEALPTCKQLGEQLIAFGDVPLFSGWTEWGITGFAFRKDGNVCTRAARVIEKDGGDQ